MIPLTIANLKMMVRNRQTLFWALFFPLLLVVVFGLFDINGTESATTAIIDQANSPRSQELRQKLADIEFLELQDDPSNEAAARQDLEDDDLDYLLLIPPGFGESEAQHNPDTPSEITLVYNTGNREYNQLVEAMVRSLVADTSPHDVPTLTAAPVLLEGIEVNEASYFDLLLMGLVSMGIMSHSIISIAVKISTYRNQAIFKRMLVTPLAIWKYFASEITAHLVLSLVQASIIMAVGVLLFGAHIYGNLAWIFAIVILGNLVFLNIGFILSAWANNPAAASGMGNAITLPMIFFAGTFFSTASLPWVLPYLAEALPLTPMLSALRQVSIDSAPLWETWPQLATLAGWVAVTALAAIKVFRFS